MDEAAGEQLVDRLLEPAGRPHRLQRLARGVGLLRQITTVYTGIAEAIGNLLAPLSSNPFGLIAIGVVVALPFLSPILGPGAAVAQIVGVLMGTQIATGALPVQYALPTLFAIDGQVGCDFIPVGLGLGEAKVETMEVGTPAVLFSKLITSPLAVIIAWARQLRPVGASVPRPHCGRPTPSATASIVELER